MGEHFPFAKEFLLVFHSLWVSFSFIQLYYDLLLFCILKFKYSCFTMLCEFLLYSKVTLYIHIHLPSLKYFSIIVYPKMKVAQSCLTLCDPMDYTIHGILQARKATPLPSPGDLPNPGIEPGSPTLQADSLPTELSGKHSLSQENGYSSLCYT